MTGNDKKATITINGVKDGDDKELYIFETDDINGQSNTEEYEFIVLKEPDQLDLELINEYAVEDKETDISKCIARGKCGSSRFFFLCCSKINTPDLCVISCS